VIGIGNSFRGDDGVGLAVAETIRSLALPGIEVLAATGEPGAILDAWAGVDSVVVVDANMTKDSIPGRLRRWTPEALVELPVTSSHSFGLPQTYALGQALDRKPRSLVVFSVDIADAAAGVGLSAPVAAAVHDAVDAVLTELGCSRDGTSAF